MSSQAITNSQLTKKTTKHEGEISELDTRQTTTEHQVQGLQAQQQDSQRQIDVLREEFLQFTTGNKDEEKKVEAAAKYKEASKNVSAINWGQDVKLPAQPPRQVTFHIEDKVEEDDEWSWKTVESESDFTEKTVDDDDAERLLQVKILKAKKEAQVSEKEKEKETRAQLKMKVTSLAEEAAKFALNNKEAYKYV